MANLIFVWDLFTVIDLPKQPRFIGFSFQVHIQFQYGKEKENLTLCVLNKTSNFKEIIWLQWDLQWYQVDIC